MRKKLLSPAEEEVLGYSWRGLSSSEIAETLGKKIAYISKTKGTIRRKINEGLERLAKSLQLDYEELSIKDGRSILEGYQFAVDTPVYLFFTIKEGFIAWYRHSNCRRSDSRHHKCLDTLTMVKDERNIPFDKEEDMSNEYDKIWAWIKEQGDLI
ncbi:MAG: hypothetical protein ACFFDT_13860 [Candidatus Hodarchaeota archaeon]